MDQDEIIRVPVTRRAVLETGTAAAALLFSAVPRPALAAADANPPPPPYRSPCRSTARRTP
jgi:hypothetical protein